jgi:CheY-like chemotaxis protein
MITNPLLIIDDDRDPLDRWTGTWAGPDIRYRGPAPGEEALASARAEPPDMVIVDVQLPGIDGREVARQLRGDQRTAHCKIVVSSALGSK